MKIVAVEPLGISVKDFETLTAEFAGQGHELRYYMDRHEDPETLISRMQDADIVVISNIPLRENVLSRCDRLKLLSVGFTGLDHIDLGYCAKHNIQVVNAAGYSTTAVSELAVALMLDLLRHITALDGTIRQGQGRGTFLGRELRGKTVGLVGTGAIGTATARLLVAFGCRVLAYNRTCHLDAEALGVTYVNLPTLMRHSDIVSLHVPMTPETHHLIGADSIALMKPTALLVNTARGNIVDIAALAQALKEERIGGAALDVYEQEPPLPSSHPLLQAPNCICVPHIGYATREAFDIRAGIVFSTVRKYLGMQNAK